MSLSRGSITLIAALDPGGGGKRGEGVEREKINFIECFSKKN
jgi:hypothetical protein